MRTRMQAGRNARRHSRGFPFGKRSNTVNDAEMGNAGIEDRAVPLAHAETAPEAGGSSRTNRPASREAEKDVDSPLSKERTQNSTYESQATTADSPTANGNGANELRERKRSGDKRPDSTEPTGTLVKRASWKGKKLPIGQQLKFIFGSWVNILMLAIPAGFAVNYAGLDGRIVFAVNFIAIVPLAGLLSLATEEIALVFNETIGGLINATFGNAVELIVAIIALLADEIEVVKTSLIGSILSNLLLVLGMCFFFGGWKRNVQFFNKTVAQTSASLLALAVASNIVPTVFANHAESNNTDNAEVDSTKIAALSRGTSVILLVVYLAYLFFQLKTHSTVFAERSPKGEKRESSSAHKEDTIGRLVRGSGVLGEHALNKKDERDNKDALNHERPSSSDDDDEEEEEPQLNIWLALGVLLGATVLIAFCAEFMVSGIEVIAASGVSVEFVGLILVPIVGNAAEHVTAVTVAIKDKMDLAIGVAVGSSMQVSLFVIPFLVIVGWGLGKDDMNLAFDTFQVAVLFVSVLLVNYLIGDGESHWLEGFLLICLYLIIAVCAWYYPAAATGSSALEAKSLIIG
ncbi:uncharacterized protein JN550_002533 [Neoarthrinium moseri]|uniref:uncharacterized protein n=1 Tax=Neoarthrinium moseri TaxID=1658444 RepID=UPI001FDC9E05|nr:uncharacterized protein JN550_002533 [Neoarthrinium moseri]KAI1875104.1 hypothetical protein JN550_002533 [Neoarthrinium moseri]